MTVCAPSRLSGADSAASTPDREAGSNAGNGQSAADSDRASFLGKTTLEWYLDLKEQLKVLGFDHDVEWSETLEPVSAPDHFWSEFAFVVINSGMKNTVARPIYERVAAAVPSGLPCMTVFKHPGKAAAIDYVWKARVALLAGYQALVTDAKKLEYLETLPWIGPITKYHLAKNFALDVAKPDRHLVRIAGEEGTHALCARLSEASGDKIRTVDVVIWRAAAVGIIKTLKPGGKE